MFEIIEDTILDLLKIIPFLFFAFLIIEFTEHKMNHNSETVIKKAGKLGPFIGSILGAIPQCGFSVLATNLYVTRIITLGTIISIYLSTSDEMLLIMIAEKADLKIILSFLTIKIIIGMISGFIIDLLANKTFKSSFEICKKDHCDCNHNFIISALKHTIKTSLFVLIITFLLNTLFFYVDENVIKNILKVNSFLTPFISGLLGLIPNCGASVIITELYLRNILTFSESLAGLLTNSGVALLVLFRTNINIKENIKIVGILYFIGVVSAIILGLIL